MPELPDVEVFKNQVDKDIIHKKIVDVKIYDEQVLESSKSYLQKLRNQKIKRIDRQGKYLFFETKEGWVNIFHFGMTGFFELSDPEKDPDKYVRYAINFGDLRLDYNSTRKLGIVTITSNKEKFLKDKEIGRDALDYKEQEFVEMLNKSKKGIKAALMDQSTISGIGNVYSDEILFQTGIHPKKKSAELSDKEKSTLFDKMNSALKKSIKHQTDPEEMPEEFLLPHREAGKQCPKCKGKIEKIKVSGRGCFICPSCQK